MATTETVFLILRELANLYPHQIQIDDDGIVLAAWERQLAVFEDDVLWLGYQDYINDLTSGFASIGGVADAARKLMRKEFPDYNEAFQEICDKANTVLNPTAVDKEEIMNRMQAIHDSVVDGRISEGYGRHMLWVLGNELKKIRWSHPVVSFAMDQFGGPSAFLAFEPARRDFILNQFKSVYDSATKKFPYLREAYEPRSFTMTPEKIQQMKALNAPPSPTMLQESGQMIAQIRQQLISQSPTVKQLAVKAEQLRLNPAPESDGKLPLALAEYSALTDTLEKRIERIEDQVANGKLEREVADQVIENMKKMKGNKPELPQEESHGDTGSGRKRIAPKRISAKGFSHLSQPGQEPPAISGNRDGGKDA